MGLKSIAKEEIGALHPVQSCISPCAVFIFPYALNCFVYLDYKMFQKIVFPQSYSTVFSVSIRSNF